MFSTFAGNVVPRLAIREETKLLLFLIAFLLDVELFLEARRRG